MKRKTNIAVRIRRFLKNTLRLIVLSPLYYVCCLFPVKKNLVVLADGHQNSIPYSMVVLRDRLHSIDGLTVKEYFRDYSFCSPVKGLCIMLGFMPLYARAEYVFISDCFIPAAACRKRRGTTLVQLWHSGGLMKKVGIDSPEDSAAMMKDQYRNTDVFTASSDVVSDVLSHAMMIPRECFCTSGVSRIDLLYRADREADIRRRFFEDYPEYKGKKIILWTPTFRGDVHSGHLVGADDILRLRDEVSDNIVVLIKTHRFSNGVDLDTTPEFTSNELLAVADALITDYSSILFDYLYYRRPIILYAPDLAAYEAARGLYPDYKKMPAYFADDYTSLYDAVTTIDAWADEPYRARLDVLWESDMAYCDGNSTDKLLRLLKIIPE